MKNKLKKRFEELFENKRLLAIHLDGFSHTVAFDDGNEDSEITFQGFSAYAPEQSWHNATKKLFEDIPHHPYQNDAEEIIYVHPEDR